MLCLQRFRVVRNIIVRRNKKFFNLQPENSSVANERSSEVWTTLPRLADLLSFFTLNYTVYGPCRPSGRSVIGSSRFLPLYAWQTFLRTSIHSTAPLDLPSFTDLYVTSTTILCPIYCRYSFSTYPNIRLCPS